MNRDAARTHARRAASEAFVRMPGYRLRTTPASTACSPFSDGPKTGCTRGAGARVTRLGFEVSKVTARPGASFIGKRSPLLAERGLSRPPSATSGALEVSGRLLPGYAHTDNRVWVKKPAET